VTDREVFILGGFVLFVHALLTFIDYKTDSAGTGSFDFVYKAENPRRFRFNMRWNLGILIFLSVVWTVGAYEEFLS